MHTEEFVQDALRERIAPPSIGSAKARIRHAARRLGWSYSRTKDAWYADPRVVFRHNEIARIEELSGVRHGRQELRSVEDLIREADAILDYEDQDIARPYVAAFRALLGSLAGARASRGE